MHSCSHTPSENIFFCFKWERTTNTSESSYGALRSAAKDDNGPNLLSLQKDLLYQLLLLVLVAYPQAVVLSQLQGQVCKAIMREK